MTIDAFPYEFLSRPAIVPRGNVTTYVTDVLREAIVTLELNPGEAIDKIAICKRLEVSRFPVSEALARLQAEGLVDILPQRSTSVSLIRISEVSEYMLIRKALESEAVRALVGNHTDAVIAALHDSIARQRQAGKIGDRTAFHRHDCEFHEHLFAAMQFGRIKAIIESARANVDRARQLINSPRRLAITISEHEAILSAIESGNADHAAAAMRAHIDAVMSELMAFAKTNPEHFADGDVHFSAST